MSPLDRTAALLQLHHAESILKELIQRSSADDTLMAKLACSLAIVTVRKLYDPEVKSDVRSDLDHERW